MLNGFIHILIANCINLLISLINGFVLPKYLAVDTYAYIKMFQLYIQYIGFFHLGFIDGVYLELGGKDINNLSKKDVSSQILFFFIFQSLVTVLIIIVGIIINDNIFIFFALNIIPLNLATLYKYIYQATGEFKIYSRILNLTSFLTLFVNLILLLVFKIQDYTLYLMFTTIVNIIIVFIIHKGIKNIFSGDTDLKFKLKEQLNYIYNGFFLMIGNFSSIILTSMDRWFVKFLLSIQDFAYYSFAISIESLITTFTTPITITMFNYFCKNPEEEKITFIRNSLFIIVLIFLSSAFIVKGIINIYLVKYINAVNIIFILFAAQFFAIIIKGIYINLYKVEKKQKTYFKKMIFIVILGAILNVLFGYIYNSIESYAFATLISFIIWFILCLYDFPLIKFNFSNLIFIVIGISFFLFLGFYINFIYGFLIYMLIVLIISFLFLKKELKFIVHKIIIMLKSILVKYSN